MDKLKKNENLLVGIVSVAVIILMLIVFGYDNIKFWLSTPIVWKAPDHIELNVIPGEKLESTDSLKVKFIVSNNSAEKIKDFEIFVYGGHKKLELNGFMNPDIDSYDSIIIEETIGSDGDYKGLYKKLSRQSDGTLPELKYHVKRLDYDNGETFKQTGIVKIIIIMGLSLAAGILLIGEFVNEPRLKLVLKFLCVPAIVLIFAVILFLAIAGRGGGSSSSSDSAKQAAARDYKRYAGYRANAMARGNQRDAAFAQAQMDKAMADMMTGSKSSDAKKAFKREANLRAGAAAHGNTAEAARAEARMAGHFADMMKDSDK